jgi:hypothetical protein
MPEMVMPETLMPEMAKLGKIIARQEFQMPAQKCHRRDTQEPVVRHQAGIMMIIPEFRREFHAKCYALNPELGDYGHCVF